MGRGAGGVPYAAIPVIRGSLNARAEAVVTLRRSRLSLDPFNSRSPTSKRCCHNPLGFRDDRIQVLLIAEALGIDLVDILGS